jgi:hypothetical protein
MTHPCDECESRIRLAEQDKAIEKVLDLAQAAELDQSVIWKEWTVGFRDALREVVKLLKEPK